MQRSVSKSLDGQSIIYNIICFYNNYSSLFIIINQNHRQPATANSRPLPRCFLNDMVVYTVRNNNIIYVLFVSFFS